MAEILNEEQKDYVLELIAEGLPFAEIIRSCGREGIEITKAQIRHYRSTSKEEIDKKASEVELEATQSGLARRDARINELKLVYEELKKSFFNYERLWMKRKRSLRSEEGYVVFTEREFNSSLVRELRLTLEDIAKEVGGRQGTSDFGELGGANVKGYMLVSPDTWPVKEEPKEE